MARPMPRRGGDFLSSQLLAGAAWSIFAANPWDVEHGLAQGGIQLGLERSSLPSSRWGREGVEPNVLAAAFRPQAPGVHDVSVL